MAALRRVHRLEGQYLHQQCRVSQLFWRRGTRQDGGRVGKPWRLPILKELSSIVAVRQTEEGKAAIDPVAFSASSVARFWSSSSVGQGCFLYVGFSEGSAGEGERNSPGAVRLVRDGK